MDANDLESHKTLPIFERKEEIVELILGNRVSILEGGIGSGKSTQIPQYIYDNAKARGEECRIVCTQPRAIAAKRLAEWVCSERKCPIGTLVGYQVSLKDNVIQDNVTRLLYCTPKILLDYIIKPKANLHITHIILDELHERTTDMDFLLVLLHCLHSLDTKFFQHVKIILMSGTIDANKFANYFKGNQMPPKILKLSTHSKYPVKVHYLKDLEGMINATCIQPVISKPEITKEMFIFAFKLLLYINEMEKSEFKLNYLASALIFLPSAREVNIMYKKLDEYNRRNGCNCWLLTTFQSSSNSSLAKLTEHHSASGFSCLKIILATSEAESSLTLPDIKYVIDFCLEKSLADDPHANFSSLQMKWITKAKCRQRAGRAGRLMEGYIYRLVPQEFYEERFKEFNEPELLHGPLAQMILKAKLLNVSSPSSVLSMAVDPPNPNDVQNAILTLRGLGALSITLRGEDSFEAGDLTFMGRVMAELPLDLHLSRLIVLGYIFLVLDEAIIIAAGLMVSPLFKFDESNPHLNLKTQIKKLVWAEGSASDPLAMLNAYKMWMFLHEHNVLDKYNEVTWLNKYGINVHSIKEMHVLVEDIHQRLKKFQLFTDERCLTNVVCLDFEKELILKVIIAGAFYPNYFLYTSYDGILNERISKCLLNGQEPCNVVYFKNFNKNNIGELYAQQIKKLLEPVQIDPDNINLKFPKNTENILVSFNAREMESKHTFYESIRVPGMITSDVYKALCLRNSKLPNLIRVMPAEHDVNYALRHNYIEKTDDDDGFQMRSTITNHLDGSVGLGIYKNKITGRITHVKNCGKFYFLPASEMSCVKEFEARLNHPKFGQMLPFEHDYDIIPGTILSAHLGTKFQRAVFTNTIYTENEKLRYQVVFLDNGCTSLSKFENLRRITDSDLKISGRVIECRLAKVQPIAIRSAGGVWCEVANKFLQNVSNKQFVTMQIYSVVNGVASVYVLYKNATVNDIMIQEKLARDADESYLSKANHALRLHRKLMPNGDCVDKKPIEVSKPSRGDMMMKIQPPPKELCDEIVALEGPFSTLEAKICSLQRASTAKQITISEHSINSILLDSDPYNMTKKMLVAACVREHPDGDRVILEDTILMPNIDGFAALVAMLFCPIVEIKCDANRTRYTEIVVGLGSGTSSQQPLFPPFHMVIPIDVNLHASDFEMINELRYAMDELLSTKTGEDYPSIPLSERLELQQKISEMIFRLLGKQRKLICPYGMEGKSDLGVTNTGKEKKNSLSALADRLIFPVFKVEQLDMKNVDRRKRDLIKHCKELRTVRNSGKPFEPVTCLLCNELLENIHQLNIHLLSKLHLDMEKEINTVHLHRNEPKSKSNNPIE